ncbi:MAG: Bax inhibitor-1 family protein [Crocinitomicaceae bacterium]
MNNNNYEIIDSEFNIADLSRAFFANVYKYMFLALTISGLVAYFAASSGVYLEIAYTATGISPMGYIIMFAPLGLVLLIQYRYQKMQFTSVMGLFLLYSALIGLSLSFIFYVYTDASIVLTFLVTGGTFGVMALLGYTTKTDLSKMGSLLYMAFIGIFIAGIVNVFLDSEPLAYVISGIGIIVFTGLTAYKMQELKAISVQTGLTSDQRKKEELMGGLVLYILFINLFMSLLRFLGDRS